MTTLEGVLNFLVAAGLVRSPDVAGIAPPLWLEPDEGVPAPGQGDHPDNIGATLVIGAFRSTGIAPRALEGFIRTDGVEFLLRASKAVYIHEFEPLLREALNDRTNWNMGGLVVHHSNLFRDLQRLGVDEQGTHNYSTEYLIEMWS